MATGLFQAVVECRYLHAKFLMENGVDIDSKNARGENALIGALRWISDEKRRIRMFRWLLFQGADIADSDTKVHRDSLGWAAFLNRTECMKLLVKHYEVDLNLRNVDIYDRSPLHYAVLHNNEHAVLWLTRLFMKYGLSVDIMDRYKITPYIIAAELGYQGCAKILAEVGDASLAQLQIAVFDYSHIWYGVEEWLDPRYSIESSKPLLSNIWDSLSPRQSLAGSSTAKVKFASLSAADVSEYGPKKSKDTQRNSTGPRIVKRRSNGSASSKQSKKSDKRTKKRPGSKRSTKSLASNSTESFTVSLMDKHTESSRSSPTKVFHTRAESVKFLPDIDSQASWISQSRHRYSRHDSVKEKTIPLIFDLYAQQNCQTFLPAVQKPKPPKVMAEKPSPRQKRKGVVGAQTTGISFGALGKVTKFAAILKAKSKAALASKI